MLLIWAEYPAKLGEYFEDEGRRESRGIESPSPRQRAPISGDSPLESPKSPAQRPHMHKCGRGENHSRSGYGQLPAKISVGEFGATVWDLWQPEGEEWKYGECLF